MRKLITLISISIIILLLSLWIIPNMIKHDLSGNLLNAQELIFENKNINSSSIETVNKSITRTKLPQQDIWIEIYANPNVLPGGVYTCRIKLWNDEVDQIDSIKIVFLAPNSKNISLGLDDKLYTSLEEFPFDSSDLSIEELPRDIHGEDDLFPGKLNSLSWIIPELPIAIEKSDTVKISFALRVESSISGSVKLNNDFLIFFIKDGKETLLLSDNKITNIKLISVINIEKTASKDTVKLGDYVNFTIYIRNSGGKDADSIFIFDELPQELKFIDFILPDDAATRTRGVEADSQKLTWLIEKLSKFGDSESEKEVGFRAKVREDIKIEDLIEEITNVAEFKRGEKDSASEDEQLFIRSDPDLIGQITSVIVPEEWRYEDSIKIESTVINQGGADVTDNLMVKLYYVDMERAPTEEIVIWENFVSASIDSPLKALGGIKPLPIQSVRFDKGGIYKFCLDVDLNNVIRERNEENNETCEIEEIRIPAKFYLSRNVIRLDQLQNGGGTPLDDGVLSIKAQVSYDGRIEIKIYDEAGELVKNLFDDFRNEGFYDLLTTWDGRDEEGNIVGSGVYVFSIKGRKFHETLKVIVVR